MDDVTRSDSSADSLAGGFYSVSDVARLLRVGRPDRVRRWFSVSDDAAGPVIARDYEPVGGVQVFSFWDMIEVRFSATVTFRPQPCSGSGKPRKATASALQPGGICPRTTLLKRSSLRLGWRLEKIIRRTPG